ncbi:MAG: sigma 54-interacting transcriptional regulator, partial [Deltaproteobacteria bacterium]|nr:sigma 54-interacting transcriptional regulator [Deltaproteobacteria bacterium]
MVFARGEFVDVIATNQEVPGITRFLTQDLNILAMLQMVAKIAPTEATVLIQGESGTGKE